MDRPFYATHPAPAERSLPMDRVAPLVAILLSTFNGARHLGEQLHGYTAQTHDVWRLYWRDDGSSDESAALIEAFAADPRVPARPIPAGLVDDPDLMLAMDQFKDVRGFTRYAARLQVGIVRAILAWVTVGFDETLGALLGIKLGPRRVNRQACDPEIVAQHPERPV